MLYKKLKALIFDFRFSVLKFHVGVRIRPLPRSWALFPYGVIPTCLWVGPVELTFCKGARFSLYSSVTFDMHLDLLSFRFNPLWWELDTGLRVNDGDYLSVYTKCGPFHVYSVRWARDE